MRLMLHTDAYFLIWSLRRLMPVRSPLHFGCGREVFLGHLWTVGQMNVIDAKTPRPVMGLYDQPLGESVNARGMKLQRCAGCGNWLYPPGPSRPSCLSCELVWTTLSGRGRIAS